MQESDTWKFSELSRLLDPSGVNASIRKHDFSKVVEEWIENVVNREAAPVVSYPIETLEKRELRSDRQTLHELERLKEDYADLLKASASTEEQLSLLKEKLEVSLRNETALLKEVDKMSYLNKELEDETSKVCQLEGKMQQICAEKDELNSTIDLLNEELKEKDQVIFSLNNHVNILKEQNISNHSTIGSKDLYIEEKEVETEELKCKLKERTSHIECIESELTVCKHQLEMVSNVVSVGRDLNRSDCVSVTSTDSRKLEESDCESDLVNVTPDSSNTISSVNAELDSPSKSSIFEEIENENSSMDSSSPILNKDIVEVQKL